MLNFSIMHKWDAQDYQQHSGVQLKWGRELIEKLKLKKDEHVLDIGCGDGKVTAEIASIVSQGRATGIDSSSDMITLACRTFPTSGYPNLDFRQMDMRELTFENAYDVAFSNAAMHWVSDHMAVLKGISRSLKKGGRILLQMGGKGNVADMLSVVTEMVHMPQWAGYFKGFTSPYSFYSPTEYHQWLPAAGLKPLRVELLDKDLAHHGREAITAWFRTTWHPYFHRVPEDMQQAFIDEAINTYISAHPAGADGIVHLKAVRLEVEAVSV